MNNPRKFEVCTHIKRRQEGRKLKCTLCGLLHCTRCEVTSCGHCIIEGRETVCLNCLIARKEVVFYCRSCMECVCNHCYWTCSHRYDVKTCLNGEQHYLEETPASALLKKRQDFFVIPAMEKGIY